MGVAVGVTLLTCQQAEIAILPDFGRHLGFRTSG